MRSIANTIIGIITQVWKKKGRGTPPRLRSGGRSVWYQTKTLSEQSCTFCSVSWLIFWHFFEEFCLILFCWGFFCIGFWEEMFPTCTKAFPLLKTGRTAHTLHTHCSKFSIKVILRFESWVKARLWSTRNFLKLCLKYLRWVWWRRKVVRWPAKVAYIPVQQLTWATKDTAKLKEKTVWVAFPRPAGCLQPLAI